jgi:transposase
MTCVIGIDIAKHTFDIAKPLERDKYRTKAKVANTPEGFKQFDQWLEKHAEPHCWVLMEATSVYHEALATHLHQQGYQVCVINPARIAKYAQSELRRVKTDKTDAKLIARYAQRHLEELRPWEPEPESIRQLRGLVRRLADLKELAQMERNRLDVSAESA